MSKIISVILSIFGIFLLGRFRGKKEEINNQTKEQISNIINNEKLNKKAASLSFNDKSDFLLSRKRKGSK